MPAGPVDRLQLVVADHGHVEGVVALVESAYRGTASRAGWTTEADLLDGQRTDSVEVGSLLDRADSEILLAERAGVLVGCCHLERGGPTEAHFGLFAVRPRLQGRGIGRWLLGEAERRAQQCYGSSTMRMAVLTARRELIAWYGGLGYELTSARRPFPYGDERFGVPRRDDLEFAVLEKRLS